MTVELASTMEDTLIQKQKKRRKSVSIAKVLAK